MAMPSCKGLCREYPILGFVARNRDDYIKGLIKRCSICIYVIKTTSFGTRCPCCNTLYKTRPSSPAEKKRM